LIAVSIVASTDAGLILSKEEKMKCFGEASEKVKTEADADLKEKILSTLVAVKTLTDAQKQKIRNNYFTGTCEPLKNFFQ
ncbi:hypothetical protein PFISCL1PPCAC_29171, partial [Pristionchus fissidentatus]